MDHQVFMDMGTYMKMLHPDDQMQQQQQIQTQSLTMAGGEQTQQEVIVQEDQTQQHVIYSPIKTDQNQQYAQDDSMQNHYLIRTQAQPGQAYYYAMNQNRIPQMQQQQQITHSQNIIQQSQNQQELVLQPPKVVVQRNPDLLQTATNMAQIVDQNPQTIQYQFAQMDQSQGQQQLIIQPTQQIKQTIYPQQPNQVVTQQQYYQLQPIQQQPNIVQQGGAKIVMGGQPIRYSFVPKQQQQQVQQIAIQNQGGQIMQINQQPQQIQQAPRQFTPRMLTGPMRIRVQSPGLTQQGQVITVQKPRTPRPRIVRPAVQTSLSQPQARPAQPGKIVYILQTQPDGSQVLVPRSQQSPQHVIRMVHQKVVQQSPSQTQFQVSQEQMPELSQQQPVQNQQQTEETHAPTTSTFTPKKDGDCDDLEDSITATAISKSARSEPPPLAAQAGVTMSIEEARKRGIQPNPSRVGVVRPIMNTTGNQLRSPTRNAALQVIRQRPPPRPQFQQPGLDMEIEVSERESAKMLVILDNGEQRLITFTLPKETCTVQELLDQVGIHVGADSNIECIENPGSEIDYIVKVGNFASRDTAAMTKAAENHIRQQQQRQQLIQTHKNNIIQHQQQQQQQQVSQQTSELAKSKSPEPKLPPPKYVNGFFALCAACGFSGADHAKCERCHRIFTEEPKMVRMPPSLQKNNVSLQAIATSTQTQKVSNNRTPNLDKKDQIEALQKKHQIATARQNAARGRGGILTATARGGRSPRGPRKPVLPEVVTLSSDDESDSEGSKSSATKALAAKQEEKILPKKYFEPEIVDDVAADDFERKDVTEFGEDETKITTSLSCRTIRIGSYKFDSKEKVVITSKGIQIVAPSLTSKELIPLNIQSSEIVKVVLHCSKQLHIIFLYTKPTCARFICGQLQMIQSNENSPLFQPMARSEPLKKIVFLAENINEEAKAVIKAIYSRQILEEISNRDANEMLVRSTGIPLTAPAPAALQNVTANESASNLQDPEVRKLLIYPPGRGGLPISTNDYMCLGSDNYLNDVIIDFYLQYIHNELLTEEQRSKTFIFSQFFYKRLTTMNREKGDPKLTAAQKRHARVANWTKNVNIFEKDFVIIPINEQSHWFLAIICFPNLTEPHTMDTNQPIKLNPPQKRGKKKVTHTVQIGNTTITALKKEDTINLGDDEGSERDEAEGDESDLRSNCESDEEEEIVDRGQPVKIPCVLIFDSLIGAPRARVVATLRDYLVCEYKAKFPNNPPRVYNKDNLLGNQVKVPQQNNFTDCGVFLLQYVEQFFKDPIKDYRIPIKSLLNWFHQDEVTRKREEIAKLLDELIRRETPEGIELPVIEFPTKDGKILETAEDTNENIESAFDDDEYVPTEEDLKELQQDQNGSKVETKRVLVPKKRSLDKNDTNNGESSAKTLKFTKK